MITMHAGWKNKWMKALRSGKYKQTNGFLYVKTASISQPRGYCCLGVLARVQGAKFVPYNMGLSPVLGKIKNEDASYLSPEFSCGMTQDQQSDLASMNDNGKSFKEIAAWIKKNVKTIRVSKKKK